MSWPRTASVLTPILTSPSGTFSTLYWPPSAWPVADPFSPTTMTIAIGTCSVPSETVPSKVAPDSGRRDSYRLQPAKPSTINPTGSTQLSRGIFPRKTADIETGLAVNRRPDQSSESCSSPNPVTAALHTGIAMLVLMLRTLPSHITVCTDPDPLNE